MVFIRPFNLHMRQVLTKYFLFWMYLLFAMGKILRHVFTGNLQKQTFKLIGAPLLQSNGHAAL